MKRYILIFIITCLGKSLAQTKYSEVPIHFNQYYNNTFNSLALNGINGSEISLLARQNFGNFGNVSTQYFSGFFNLSQKENGKNSLGLIIYNDKEGDYLRTNRFYGTFIRHQYLSSKWTISAALSSGFYLFRVKFNEVTGGVSEYAFDGSAGIALYSTETKISITLNQFANSQLSQSNNDLFLSRYMVLNALQKFSINDETSIDVGFYYKPFVLNSRDIYALGSSIIINYNKLGIGTIVDFTNGFSFVLNLNEISIFDNHNLQIQTSYYTPFKNNIRQNINTLEISCKYFF